MSDLKRKWCDLVPAVILLGWSVVGVSYTGLVVIQVQAADDTTTGKLDPRPTNQGVLQRLESEHLSNLIQVHSSVLSGGQPEGELAFEDLSRRGVRTIISVDGATPDVEMAKRFGIRYVHLPHGYDGISPERSLELGKAIHALDGPIYIHCHHGKHRSPAAAAVACVVAGLLTSEQSLRVLELAGTNPHYRGLFQSVRRATPIDASRLGNAQVEYREVADVTPVTTAMLALERTFDELHRHQEAKRSTGSSESNANTTPSRNIDENALLLREHFTELIRLDDVTKRPEDYIQGLRDSEEAAAELCESLKGQVASPDFTEPQRELLKRIKENCVSCHAAYRDSPAD